jgi:hypothetical protein
MELGARDRAHKVPLFDPLIMQLSPVSNLETCD